MYNNTGHTFDYIFISTPFTTVYFPNSLSGYSSGSGDSPFEYDPDQDMLIEVSLPLNQSWIPITVDIYLDQDPAVNPGSPFASLVFVNPGTYQYGMGGTMYPPFYGAIYLDIHY